MGKWSVISIDRIPEDVSSWISEFVKILSIKVADVGVYTGGLDDSRG